MLLRRPATHIDADLGHEFERPIRPQAWDRGQVDACAQRIQRDPDLEAGFVGTPPPRGSGRVRRLIGGLAGRLEGADLALDLVVAAADLRLVEVVALERLAKHEQMFGAVVPCERGGDLRLGGLAARVAVPGEDSGVGFARDDVT